MQIHSQFIPTATANRCIFFCRLTRTAEQAWRGRTLFVTHPDPGKSSKSSSKPSELLLRLDLVSGLPDMKPNDVAKGCLRTVVSDKLLEDFKLHFWGHVCNLFALGNDRLDLVFFAWTMWVNHDCPPTVPIANRLIYQDLDRIRSNQR